MSLNTLGPLAIVPVNIESYTGFDINLARPGNARWIATVHGKTGDETRNAEAEAYARLFVASPALLTFAEEIALCAYTPDEAMSRAREVITMARGTE